MQLGNTLVLKLNSLLMNLYYEWQSAICLAF